MSTTISPDKVLVWSARRMHDMRVQLKETRAELSELASRPLEYLNDIRVSREHAVSYMETMLAQERRLMRDLDVSHQRGICDRQTDLVAALGSAARMLRATACQPANELGDALRINLTIAAKAAEIALR